MSDSTQGFKSAADVIASRFALGVAILEKDHPGARLEFSTWETALNEARQQGEELFREHRRTVAKSGLPKSQRKAVVGRNSKLREQVNVALQSIDRKLKPIASLPPAEQRRELDTLFHNYVMHFAHLTLAGVPGSAIVAPDWEAVRGRLQTASSEQVLLNLETAFSHGKFSVSPDSDFPIANISGSLGGAGITAHAELRSDLDTPETRAIMRELAERLRDPRVGLGPRVQETVQALMSLWLTRRDASGAAVVTISELAGELGYEHGPNGFHPDAYEQIRGFVKAAASTNLRAMFPDSPGRPRIEEKAFTFTYFDREDDAAGNRPSDAWIALGFRPGEYLARGIDRSGALLKGFDRKLNQLHPVNERAELLLGKYLENHWRFNWNNAAGIVRRSVRELLIEGIGMGEQTAARPAMATLTALSDALDRLEEMGTIKSWEADERWQAVYDALAPGGRRRRMSGSLWRSALEACVTIEAGKQYHAHYRNHGLTYKERSDADPIHALRNYMARSNRSQAMIASDLHISPAMLSRLLTGKRTASPELAERIDSLVNQGTTLTLPLIDPNDP
jgi:hypothetical protein